MSKTIWKYELQMKDQQTIEMPKGAELLSVQVQFGIPVLWALVNPDAELVSRRIGTHGTGHSIQHGGRFIGTYQVCNGELVFHVFEF